MVAVAEQISFVSAFLGGVAATILFSLIIFSSDRKAVSISVATSAFAACSLLISVIAGWRLAIGLHPDLPFTPDPAKIEVLWHSLIAGYSLGVVSLILSIGVSGWIRSRRSGLITSCIGAIAILFFASTSIYV